MHKHFTYIRGSKGDTRRSARLRLAVTVTVVVSAAICLLCLPGISSQFPFSHNRPSNTEPLEQRASRDSCDDSERAPAACNEELQEIVELTDPGDTLASLMFDNISDESAAQKVADRLAANIQQYKNTSFDSNTALPQGSRYTINLDRDGRFLKASIELDSSSVFHVARETAGLRAWKDEVVLDFKPETVTIRMKGSLQDSVLTAGEGQDLFAKIKDVFQWDIDFRSEARRGDVCTVLLERKYADDRPSGYGRILCAVYDGKKTKKTAVRFNEKYYDKSGEELKKDFLRTPLREKLKITSKFGNRFHPIDRIWKRHDGVDYGAPAGTPVLSIAGGVVTFAGWNNGYGNYVCIRHDNGCESRYGHLQRIEKRVQVGARLKQGDRVGLVGMTGKATGPHLDFQLLVNGRHEDPQRVKMVQSPRTVPQPLRPRFDKVCAEHLLSLERTIMGKTAALSSQSALD